MNIVLKEPLPSSFLVDHPFTNIRVGVIGKNKANIDYDGPLEEVRPLEKRVLIDTAEVPPEHIVFAHQVHGDGIITVNETPGEDLINMGEGDALITPLPGICMVIRTADCIPVFLYDSKEQAIGAIHSGWRSTQMNICKKVIEKMEALYGSKGENLFAWILPGIGPDSYEVKEDVARFFPEDINQKDGKLFLDLGTFIRKELISAGVPEDNVAISRLCTFKDNSHFYSHRRGEKGRNLNYIMMIP